MMCYLADDSGQRKKLCFIFIGLMTCVFVAVASYHEFTKLPYLRARVFNSTDFSELERPELPDFIQQDPNAARLLEFRSKHLAQVVHPGMDKVEQTIAVQHWVRSQENDYQFYHAQGPNVDGTEDPETYLNMQRIGIRSSCRRFSYILMG